VTSSRPSPAPTPAWGWRSSRPTTTGSAEWLTTLTSRWWELMGSATQYSTVTALTSSSLSTQTGPSSREPRMGSSWNASTQSSQATLFARGQSFLGGTGSRIDIQYVHICTYQKNCVLQFFCLHHVIMF